MINRDQFAPTENWVEKIYLAAKANDKDALTAMLKGPVCIDERYARQLLTPAGKLAAEGNIEAVELLITLGADLNWIAFGAALGGQNQYAELCRKRGAHVNYLVWGAAAGSHFNYAEFLMKYHGAHPAYFAFGIGLSGCISYVDRFCNRYDQIDKHIAAGAVFAGHCENNKFFKNFLMDVCKNKEVIAFISYYFHDAEYQPKTEAILRNKQHDDDAFAYGVMIGGNIDSGEALRLQGVSVNALAMGAAFMGHWEYTEYLLRHFFHVILREDVGRYAAWGGNISYANYLHDKYAIDRVYSFRGSLSAGNIRAADHWYRTSYEYSMTSDLIMCPNFFWNVDANIRQLYICRNQMFQLKISNYFCKDSHSSLKIANKIKTIQDKFRNDYDMSYVWVANKEARQFIQRQGFFAQPSAERPGLPRDVLKCVLNKMTPTLTVAESSYMFDQVQRKRVAP